MKITKFFLMAALALTFAACSNDDNDFQNSPQPAKAEGITITATLAPKTGGADTRALTPGDNKIVASWAVGEKIAILYEKGGTKYVADAEIKSVDQSGAATIEFSVESGTADGTACKLIYPISAVYGKKLKRPENYTDVRGQVVNDYQDMLEKAWVYDLRQKYSFSVNKDLLKTVNKH